ncbi:hypothetical protein ACFVJK_41000 [Streptomyces sp. NPDC127172]|uniref:hypothetical protein n=1 Tax=Streptomyces sp. NPDC127172 TaxID=3345382 RepID=UPI0036442CA6
MSTRTQAIPSVVPAEPATFGPSSAAAMRRASRSYPARRVAGSVAVTEWIAARQHLGTPLLLVRDNLNVHLEHGLPRLTLAGARPLPAERDLHDLLEDLTRSGSVARHPDSPGL